MFQAMQLLVVFFTTPTNSTGDKGYVLTSDDNGPLWKASGDFDGLSADLIAHRTNADDGHQCGCVKLNHNRSNFTGLRLQQMMGICSTLTSNLITTGQTLQTQITANDGDISTLTSNLITAGQTLQTQITSNDTDIANNTANLITSGQTLQTQITNNDGDIATNATNIATNVTNITTNASNISSNDTDIATNVTNIATNVTNISTNAWNLVLTGTQSWTT